MKIDSSVIRRTPTHWIARPTFESIDCPRPRLGERVEKESFWAEGLGLKDGLEDQPSWILAEEGASGQEFFRVLATDNSDLEDRFILIRAYPFLR